MSEGKWSQYRRDAKRRKRQMIAEYYREFEEDYDEEDGKNKKRFRDSERD